MCVKSEVFERFSDESITGNLLAKQSEIAKKYS